MRGRLNLAFSSASGLVFVATVPLWPLWGCADADSTFRDERAEHLGHSEEALTKAEFTAVSHAGTDFAESAASVFYTASGAWGEAIASGQDYGCTYNAYSTWCNYTGQFGAGADPTLVLRWSATKYLYAAQLNTTQGVHVLRTSDPCPTGCAPTSWSACDVTGFGSNSPDYPTLLWKNDQVWIVVSDAGHLTAVQLNDPWTTGTCAFSRWIYGTQAWAPRAAFDSSGRIHIVYDDATVQKIRHATFDTINHTWSAQHDIGPSVWGSAGTTCTDGTGNCPGVPTLAGLGSNCLMTRSHADIAVDQTVNPNTLVVTYNTQGGGTCNTKQEQRWYRSTGAGTSWTYQQVTGCNTSVYTAVRHYSDPGHAGVSGRFDSRSSYIPTGDNRLRESRWKSTDGGLSFAGVYVSAARAVNAPIAGCWWGDYEGLAADVAQTSFIYSWGSDQNPPGPDWVIRATAYDKGL